jgi:hypothetical protein
VSGEGGSTSGSGGREGPDQVMGGAGGAAGQYLVRHKVSARPLVARSAVGWAGPLMPSTC